TATGATWSWAGEHPHPPFPVSDGSYPRPDWLRCVRYRMKREIDRARKLRKIRALEQGTAFGGEAAAARARISDITGVPLTRVSLRTALEDPKLLGNAIPGDSWKAWRALLLASRGEALKDDELILFQELTERQEPPVERVQEFYCVIGRRGGKSRAIASLLTYLATMVDYRKKLASGEIPV